MKERFERLPGKVKSAIYSQLSRLLRVPYHLERGMAEKSGKGFGKNSFFRKRRDHRTNPESLDIAAYLKSDNFPRFISGECRKSRRNLSEIEAIWELSKHGQVTLECGE